MNYIRVGGEILKFSNRTNSNITSTDEASVNINNNNGNQITNGDKEITYFDQLSPLHRKKIVVSYLDIDLKDIIRYLISRVYTHAYVSKKI